MLVGKKLLEKSKSLSKQSENEIARRCGYVGPSGRIMKKSFYRALVQAKGFKLGNNILLGFSPSISRPKISIHLFEIG